MNVFKKLEQLTAGQRAMMMDLIQVEQAINEGSDWNLTDLYEDRDKLRSDLTASGVEWEPLIAVSVDSTDDYIDTGVVPAKKVKKVKKAKASSTSSGYQKCAHSHPALTIDGVGDIQGGSCYTPQGKYDVEILLCYGATLPRNILPWETTLVRYAITDGMTPSDFKAFDRLIDWTIGQMKSGKKVHVGCIGGHGRTGLFLSALVAKATGNKDAITWVREHYCEKAVETTAQVTWLHTKYGITKAKPSKNLVSSFGTKSSKAGKTSSVVYPLKGRSIWGPDALV